MFKLSNFRQAVANAFLLRPVPPEPQQPVPSTIKPVAQFADDPLLPPDTDDFGRLTVGEYISALPTITDFAITEVVEAKAAMVGDSANKTMALDDGAGASTLKTVGVDGAYCVPDGIMQWYMGQTFIGYQQCALIAQQWLVSKACKVVGEDAVRNGYELTVADGTEVPSDVLDELKRFDERMKILKHCANAHYWMNVYGVRIVLFVVESKDPKYYEKPFNIDGVTKGSYKGIRPVSPYWVAPELSMANSNDPASLDFYEPDYWVISGKKYHKSHLVILRGQEPADFLKPLYYYGGIPLTQQIYERIYAAERTANEAPLLALEKRTTAIHVDLKAVAANQKKFLQRLADWVGYRNNQAVKVLGQEETMEQFDTSLADFGPMVDGQYELVAAIAGVPATKLLEKSPSGMNATGEYEANQYNTKCETVQTDDLGEIVERHHFLAVKSLGYDFKVKAVWNPVATYTASELAELNSKKVAAGVELINAGVISPDEERQRLRDDRHSGYNGLADEGDVDADTDLVNVEREKAEGGDEPPTPPSGGAPAPQQLQESGTQDIGGLVTRLKSLVNAEPGNRATNAASMAEQLTTVWQQLKPLAAAGGSANGTEWPELLARLENTIAAMKQQGQNVNPAGAMATTVPSTQRTASGSVAPGVVGVYARAKEVPENEQIDYPTVYGPAKIENPRGSVRSGQDGQGRAWDSKMPAHYGYLVNNIGADGEGLDVFLNHPAKGSNVYVVNQNHPDSGAFDEHKCMLGFANAVDAEATYRKAFSKDWKGFDSIHEVAPDKFREWIKGDLTKPYSPSDKTPPTGGKPVGDASTERKAQKFIAVGQEGSKHIIPLTEANKEKMPTAKSVGLEQLTTTGNKTSAESNKTASETNNSKTQESTNAANTSTSPVATTKASANSVSGRQKEALVNYTGAMFRDVNSALREGSPVSKEDRSDLKHMDEAFSGASTTEDKTVYRGATSELIEKLVPGATFTDNAFTSTTSDPDIAKNFARGAGSGVMEIRVPKGSKALDLTDISQFSKAEKETLLNRGGKFKVVSVQRATRTRKAKVVLEYIG